jgi:hypothetical protein
MIGEISRILGVGEKEGSELIRHGDLKSLSRFQVALTTGITNMSLRMREVVDSDAERDGLKRYLRHCFRNQVLPLPLLGGRGSKSQTLRELLLEDLTVSPKQAFCLAENLPRFGHAAVKKLRLTNNNLGDDLVALVLDAAARNRSVESLEIAHNQVGPAAADAIAQLIMTAPSFRTLYLNSTHTPKAAFDRIVEALCKYAPRTLRSLTLLHAEITDTRFVQQLQTLTHLELQPNSVVKQPEQLTGLMGSTHHHLSSLNLQGFHMHVGPGLDDISELGLVPFVERHRHLVHVNLSNNALDVATLERLCRELGSSCGETLEALHLGHNGKVNDKSVRKQLLSALRITSEQSNADDAEVSSTSSTGTELAKLLLDAAPQTHHEVEDMFRAHKYGKKLTYKEQMAALAREAQEKAEAATETPITRANVRGRPYAVR